MSQDLIARIPPHNIEAEQSLLGSLLIDKEAIVKVGDMVTPEDFYKDTHRMIFDAIVDLYGKHEPIDLLSLGNRLEEKSQLDIVGGRSYLISLANVVPTSSNVVHYAQIIQKRATLRRLQSAASEIGELAYQTDGEIETLLDKAEQTIFGVSQKFIKRFFVPLKDILNEAFERIDELHRDKGKLRGIPTGYVDLDNMLAGLQRSDLLILAARPSVGKTSFALDIARNISVRENTAVAIFSLEMSKEQLVDRMICAEAGIDLWRMRTGKLSDRSDSDDFMRIGHAMNSLSGARIFIDDTASANIMEVRTKARRLQTEHGLDVVIIDYLQLMEGHSKTDGRVQEVSEITRGLKAIARELNVPVIALSQLSRAVEVNKPAIPKLAHLRESGCLSADTLIMDAHTGKRYLIGDLAKREIHTPIPIHSLDENWNMVIKPLVKAFSSGKKQLFELTLRSGRKIKASKNHPFRTIAGWIPLENLAMGTSLALPRSQTSTRMERLAATCASESLSHLAHSDVVWDSIVSITPLGVEEVFDATVEDTHNFVANDIFVHNSIEQDADVVLFLYRKAADRNYRLDELSEEDKRSAELHIAKHRNGPTGVVNLIFDEARASYKSISHHHGAPSPMGAVDSSQGAPQGGPSFDIFKTPF